MCVCKICSKIFKSNAGLGHHIKSTHKLSTEDYYNMFNKGVNKNCKICGSPNKFRNFIIGYNDGCCGDHILMIKYGVKNVFQLDSVKDTSARTKSKRYGDSNYNNRDRSRETSLIKYGVENISQLQSIKVKKMNRSLERYGVPCVLMSEEIRELGKKTKLMQYGDENFTNREKYYQTMKIRGHVSKYELAFENILNQLNINYKVQYKCDKYPYFCDFYLPNMNMFIELHLYPSHGHHPYDKNNIEDINKLNDWKKRSRNSPIYSDWIKVWAVVDIEKRNTAIANNLNYYTLYSIDDINNFILNELNSDLKINTFLQQ